MDHRRRRRRSGSSTSAAGASCPTAASLNVAEEGWRELGELLAERGVWIEIGLFAPRHPEELAESGLAAHCRRALVEPQETSPETALTTAGAIDGHLDRQGVALPQLHHGLDLTTWAVLDAAVRREREIRIGFEDTLRAPGRAARELERRARRRRHRALRRQDIRLTASSAATLYASANVG